MLNQESNAATDATRNTSLEFCLRLTRANAVITRRADNALASVHGLSFGDFMVLYHLHHAAGGRLRRIELAERLGLTASGVTRTLLPLEKLGLVAREPDPRDARVGYAMLTEAGQRLYADALTSAEPVCKELTSVVPADQLGELFQVLGRLAGINLSNA